MANHGRRLRAAVREQARSGSLLTDSVWGLAHDGLQLVVTFASFIVLGRKLGAANYGAYLGMFGVIGPISGLTWGTYLAVLQRALRERDDPQIVASSAVTYALLMGAAAAALASIVGLLVIPTLDVASIVLISVSELILFSAAYVSAALVQASHGYAAASRVRIAIAPAKLIVLGVLLAFDAVSVRNVATGSVIIFGLILTTLLVAVLPRYGIRPRPTVPSRDLVTTSLTFALPMSAASVQSDGDKAVLNFYGMQSAAGLYGAAGRIVSVGMMPLRALDSAAFQRFLPHDPSLKGQHVRRTLKYCRLSLSLCALIGVSLFFAAPHLGFLLGDGFEGSESMIRWLTLYLPALAVSGAPLNGLLGLGKVRTRAAISLASGALSLGLYIALIPRLSWKGAVIGTIVGEVFLAAVGWTALIRAQRRFDSGVDAGPDESHTPRSGAVEDAMVAMAASPDGSSPA